MNEGDDSPGRVVFLFDVDNTLLDNDRVAADLQRHLAGEIGADGAQEYWRIFEELRTELGYADYLGALQRYRAKHPHAQRLLCMFSTPLTCCSIGVATVSVTTCAFAPG